MHLGKKVVVVMPAYNAEETLKRTYDEVMAQGVVDLVIVVDDASHDDTLSIARTLPDTIVHAHDANRGYGGALKSGFAAARKDYVFFTDGDGQFDVAEIDRLLPLVPEHDVVVGYRLTRAEGGLRSLNATCWNWLVRRLFGIPVRDVDCAFKLFKREVFDRVRPEAEGAMISTELLARLVRAGFTIQEVGVHHHLREYGAPTGANPLVIARAFYELFKLYRKITAETA